MMANNDRRRTHASTSTRAIEKSHTKKEESESESETTSSINPNRVSIYSDAVCDRRLHLEDLKRTISVLSFFEISKCEPFSAMNNML
jgi:hypothetical protein